MDTHYKICFSEARRDFGGYKIGAFLTEWLANGAPGCCCEEYEAHWKANGTYGNERWTVNEYVNSTR